MIYDCGLKKENNRFRYRATAIIVEDGYVLFAGNEKEDYFYSIGGAVHLGETSEDAVKREVYEETGVIYEIDHLAVIHENFFIEVSESKMTDCQEIAFYYLMKPRGTRILNSQSYTCENIRETMHWIPVEDLDKYKAFPSFMKEYLQTEHFGIEHIVTDERV